MSWIYNPKTQDSGIITCIPQKGECPNKCEDCFFQSGRSYLEPLSKNLPHIPSKALAKGRVVRMNDGNDSNVERELVERTAQQYNDYFFNTSQPYLLNGYSGPVVFTINPGEMTDRNFVRLNSIPKNLMFVRVRVNAWNVSNVVERAVKYYTDSRYIGRATPLVLTFMAYYTSLVPVQYKKWYKWTKRTLNNYWVLKPQYWQKIMDKFKDNSFVYSCGTKYTHACRFCGNCLRAYYATKERMRNEA